MKRCNTREKNGKATHTLNTVLKAYQKWMYLPNYETNIYIREKTWNTRMIIKKRKAGCLNKYFNLGTL